MTKRTTTLLALLLTATSAYSNAFSVPFITQQQQRQSSPRSLSTSLTSLSATDAETEAEISSILRPSYAIESIPLRIGHGFDIHRMVPLEEAGQPVVIGGVVIDHEDQKVGALVDYNVVDWFWLVVVAVDGV